MIYQVGVEDIEPNSWAAWSFDHPGLIGKGRTREAAIAQLQIRLPAGEIRVTEEFRFYPAKFDPEYLVNAFFEDDRRPLTEAEVQAALDDLIITRRDFLAQLALVPPKLLEQPIPGEVFKSIAGIARHVAGADCWYCERMDGRSACRDGLPDALLARLAQTRDFARAYLPTLVADTRIVTIEEELWSARKVMRRMLWHEWDHTGHIAERLRELTG